MSAKVNVYVDSLLPLAEVYLTLQQISVDGGYILD